MILCSVPLMLAVISTVIRFIAHTRHADSRLILFLSVILECFLLPPSASWFGRLSFRISFNLLLKLSACLSVYLLTSFFFFLVASLFRRIEAVRLFPAFSFFAAKEEHVWRERTNAKLTTDTCIHLSKEISGPARAQAENAHGNEQDYLFYYYYWSFYHHYHQTA